METNDENTQPTQNNQDFENLSVVEQGKSILAEYKELNKNALKHKEENREIDAKRMLGGISTSQPSKETKEETNKEYRDRIGREISEGMHND